MYLGVLRVLNAHSNQLIKALSSSEGSFAAHTEFIKLYGAVVTLYKKKIHRWSNRRLLIVIGITLYVGVGRSFPTGKLTLLSMTESTSFLSTFLVSSSLSLAISCSMFSKWLFHAVSSVSPCANVHTLPRLQLPFVHLGFGKKANKQTKQNKNPS